MVQLLKNDFEGLAVGATLTTALSGQSGDAFSHVLPEAGQVKVTDEAFRGTRAIELLPPAAAPGSSARWTLAESHGRVMVSRRPFYFGGVHAGARTLMSHFATLVSPAVQHGWCQVRANTAQLELAYGNGTFLNNARINLPEVGWYIAELVSIAASVQGASDGSIGLRAWKTSGGIVGAQLKNTLEQDLFTGLPITHNHPSAVRWGTAVSSSGFARDVLDIPQMLATDDLSSRLAEFAETRQLGAVQNVRIVSATQPTGTGASDGKLKVAWDALADSAVGAYQVAIAPGANARDGFVVVATVPANVLEREITGLAPGDYRPVVRAMPVVA